jgi:hypothetical protein
LGREVEGRRGRRRRREGEDEKEKTRRARRTRRTRRTKGACLYLSFILVEIDSFHAAMDVPTGTLVDEIPVPVRLCDVPIGTLVSIHAEEPPDRPDPDLTLREIRSFIRCSQRNVGGQVVRHGTLSTPGSMLVLCVLYPQMFPREHYCTKFSHCIAASLALFWLISRLSRNSNGTCHRCCQSEGRRR